jgi:ubiquinone/menaquinone biosynthesis C-methylase UbiE
MSDYDESDSDEVRKPKRQPRRPSKATPSNDQDNTNTGNGERPPRQTRSSNRSGGENSSRTDRPNRSNTRNDNRDRSSDSNRNRTGRSTGGTRRSNTSDRQGGRNEGYRPVNSGARRNTDSDSGGGNRRPYQRRSENRSDSSNEGYRPVNSGPRRNTEGNDENRSEGNRRPYQRSGGSGRPGGQGQRGDRPNRDQRPARGQGSEDRGSQGNSSGRPSQGRGGSRRGGYKEYDPSTAPTKRGARTGWDAVASWYDGWVGKDGSKHHQQLAIPATMELLELREDEKLLDIGAGQGVLATYVTQVGAEYTGVDVSPRLLDLARKHHGMYGHFVQADACKLAQSNEIQEAGYDAAAFLLSLQDINPLQDALDSASWALKPGGRMVLLMTHPCFRIPRQSGWGYDENRKLTYRRVDHYMTPLNVPMKSYLGGSGVTISFHRPLHEYVNGLAAAGLVIDQMREITSYKADENAAESEIPVFMALRARKLKG